MAKRPAIKVAKETPAQGWGSWLRLLQQNDVVQAASCQQHGVFVVAERVAVMADNDNFHLITPLPLLFIVVAGTPDIGSPDAVPVLDLRGGDL